MKVFTYLESSTEVLAELDMALEDFIGTDELIGYFNEAISSAESEIHKLGVEDEYFRKPAYLSLVNGTAAYSPPSDIFANKIRGIQYSDGGTVIYEVKKLRRWHKFDKMAHILATANTTEDYQYDIENDSSSTGYKVVLYPPSRETSSSVMQVWYVREAQKIPTLASGATQGTINATKIDIPQFNAYVRQFVKVCMAEKEGHPMLDQFMGKLQYHRTLMIDTLTEMVVDDNTTVEPDFSHYHDMS